MEILDESKFSENHLYFAVKGKLQIKLDKGDFEKSLQKAIALSPSEMEKAHLRAALSD